MTIIKTVKLILRGRKRTGSFRCTNISKWAVAVTITLATLATGLVTQAHADTTLYYTGKPFDPSFCSPQAFKCATGNVTAAVTFDSTVTSDFTGAVVLYLDGSSTGVVSFTVSAAGTTITRTVSDELNPAYESDYCEVDFINGQIVYWNIYVDEILNGRTTLIETNSDYDDEVDIVTNPETYGINQSTPGTWGLTPPSPPGPVASFTAEPTHGKAPLKVHFANSSVGSFTKCLWNFGDGGTSKIWNPNHTYKKAGTYTVTLTMTGAMGTFTCTQLRLITAYAAPKANFSATPRSGDFPLTVNFTNVSTGVITSWLWNFGDGTTSTDGSPDHTYYSPRTYKPKLTVYGPGGGSSKTGSIRVEK